MVSLKNLLVEATLNLQKDVDYIYEHGGFRKFLDDINAGKRPYYNEIRQDKSVDISPPISSHDLKSPVCVKANKLNPIRIECGFGPTYGNYYHANKQLIRLSFNYQALQFLYSPDEYLLSSQQTKMIQHEITEYKIKATISHELTHWIRDSQHNRFLTKILGRHANATNAKEAEAIKSLNLPNVNMTSFEIDAQIAGIKSLKIKYKSIWDTMTFVDLFYKYISLMSIYNMLRRRNDGSVKVWLKNLISRMHRENLLGKNMRNPVATIDKEINSLK